MQKDLSNIFLAKLDLFDSRFTFYGPGLTILVKLNVIFFDFFVFIFQFF